LIRIAENDHNALRVGFLRSESGVVYNLGDMGKAFRKPRVQDTLAASYAPGDSPIEKAFAAAWYVTTGDYPAPQVQIGPHRVDFLIQDIVVECDGHKFHSSKKQRALDVRRDRYLVGQGYRVVRFTGSEIHKDALTCAKEVQGLCKFSIAHASCKQARDFFLAIDVQDWNRVADFPSRWRHA
jgi:hypothetical protein